MERIEDVKKREESKRTSSAKRPSKKYSKASISTVESIKGRTADIKSFNPFLKSKIEGLKEEENYLRDKRRKQFIRRTKRSFLENYVKAKIKKVLVHLMAASSKKIQLNRLTSFAKHFSQYKIANTSANKKSPQNCLLKDKSNISLLIKEKSPTREAVESGKQLFWAGKAYHKMKRKKLKVEKVKGKIE